MEKCNHRFKQAQAVTLTACQSQRKKTDLYLVSTIFIVEKNSPAFNV